MTEPLHCFICGRPLTPPYHIIGRRAYCEEHFQVVNRQHRSFWRAGLTMILGMALFSAVVAAIAARLPALDRTTLLAVGIFLAVVPTALWLLYFVQQDQLEPEPKTKLAAVFVVALVLTEVVGLPVINWFFQEGWAGINPMTGLLANVLVLGFVLEATKYAAVRLMVYDTEEFDERMDGPIYGTTAGLGVATLVNLNYIVGNGGVALAPGVIHVVVLAMAQASFGGLLGYVMAQAKFEHRPLWWVPAGLVVVAVLDGVFTWVVNQVSATGLTVDPWRSLAVGIVLALGAFLLLVGLMRRATAEELQAAAVGTP